MAIPDSTAGWMQGIQIGSNIASNAMAQRLRIQELKSIESLRRVQERAAVQEMELQLQANNRQIEYAAEMQKAVGAAQLASSSVIPVPGFGVMPNPNPLTDTQAAMRFVLPTIAKFEPQKVQPTMEALALNEIRSKTVGIPRPQTPQQIAATKALEEQRRSGANLNQARIDELKSKTSKTPEQIEAEARASGLVPSGLNARGEMTYSRPGTKQVIRSDGKGGFEIISGATDGDISNADRSNLRMRTVKLEDTVRRIQPLIDNADKIFGARALAGTVVVDRGLANLVPGLVVGERVQGRTAAKFAIEGLIRSLTEGQGQLSNQDVARIKGLFPELGNPAELLENPARAQQILKNLQKQLARDASTDARMLGESPTADVMRHADPAYLLEEYRAKRISADQFREAINNNVHREDAEALLNGL